MTQHTLTWVLQYINADGYRGFACMYRTMIHVHVCFKVRLYVLPVGYYHNKLYRVYTVLMLYSYQQLKMFTRYNKRHYKCHKFYSDDFIHLKVTIKLAINCSIIAIHNFGLASYHKSMDMTGMLPYTITTGGMLAVARK